MTKISSIRAREILDSRGNPTLAVTLTTDSGHVGRASVPSGASTGLLEAIELRDGDKKRYQGKGVLTACAHVEGAIQSALRGSDISDQRSIDQTMIELDGTPNKARLGANAILGVSLAAAHAQAASRNLPLYHSLDLSASFKLPTPMLNIINGGAHANNLIDYQEFMLVPRNFPSFAEALRAGVETYHILKEILSKKGFSTAVGDEGGFAPDLPSNEEVLTLLVEAISKAGYEPGKDIALALDCAASFFYEHGNYLTMKKRGSCESRSPQEQVAYLKKLTKEFPIISIEDGMAEEDYEGWAMLTKALGHEVQIVGDDLFVTNCALLQKGIDHHLANAILIKPNQIGTLSETLDAILLAGKHHFTHIISHRSGETEDVTIADLAVSTNAAFIKTGAPARSERCAKYNRLLEIEAELQHQQKTH